MKRLQISGQATGSVPLHPIHHRTSAWVGILSSGVRKVCIVAQPSASRTFCLLFSLMVEKMEKIAHIHLGMVLAQLAPVLMLLFRREYLCSSNHTLCGIMKIPEGIAREMHLLCEQQMGPRLMYGLTFIRPVLLSH